MIQRCFSADCDCMSTRFRTSVPATGTGIPFNWGQLAKSDDFVLARTLMTMFGGDDDAVGSALAMVYGPGIIVIGLSSQFVFQSLDRASQFTVET